MEFDFSHPIETMEGFTEVWSSSLCSSIVALLSGLARVVLSVIKQFREEVATLAGFEMCVTWVLVCLWHNLQSL